MCTVKKNQNHNKTKPQKSRTDTQIYVKEQRVLGAYCSS